MDVRLALTADYVALDTAGKMNVIGIFQNIHPISLPFTYPLMFVAYRFECNPAEVERPIQLELILQNQDGEVEIKVGPWSVTVPRQDPGVPVEFPMIFRIDNWVISAFGDRQWVLLMNGIEKNAMRMRVLGGPVPTFEIKKEPEK